MCSTSRECVSIRFVIQQQILSQVVLGALVTRFAVLFTAGGPAGMFADEKEEEKSR